MIFFYRIWIGEEAWKPTKCTQILHSPLFTLQYLLDALELVLHDPSKPTLDSIPAAEVLLEAPPPHPQCFPYYLALCSSK